MSSVVFRSVSKSYREVRALDQLDLVVEAQSFTVVCGPPKSGKSALFRSLVGLESIDEGIIEPGGAMTVTFGANLAPNPQYWPACVDRESGYVLVEVHTQWLSQGQAWFAGSYPVSR